MPQASVATRDRRKARRSQPAGRRGRWLVLGAGRWAGLFIVIAAFLVATGQTAAAVAAPVNISLTSQKSSDPAIAVDAAGNVHVAWMQDASQTTQIVHASWTASGAWSGSTVIAQGPAFNPTIAVDAQGSLHAAWSEYVLNVPDVFYARRPLGGGWSGKVKLSASEFDSLNVSLVVDAQREVHAVWYETPISLVGLPPPPGGGVYYARRPPDGAWTKPALINAEATSPTLAVDGAGNLHAVWARWDVDAGIQRIFSAAKPRGGDWGSEAAVSGPSTPRPELADLAVDAAGQRHVVWRDEDLEEIFYASSTPDGRWSDPVNISGTAGNSTSPSLAVGSDGTPQVAWHDSTTDDWEVLYARGEGNGAWTAPTILSTGDGTALGAAVSVDGTGTRHVVWVDLSSGAWDIYYWSSGAVWPAVPSRGTAVPWTNISKTSGGSGDPSIVVDEAGSVHVAWDERTPNGEATYYAQRSPRGDWGDAIGISELFSEVLSWAPRPRLAVDSGGALHAAWDDNQGIGYATRSSGGSWSVPVRISEAGAIAKAPSISVGPGGTVHVAWSQAVGDTFDVFYVARPPGAGWTAPTDISNTTTSSESPDIAAGPGGAVHVAWIEEVVFSADLRVFYASRTAGDAWSPPSILGRVTEGRLENVNLRLVADGTLHVIWRTLLIGDDEIWYRTRTSAGTWIQKERLPAQGELRGAGLGVGANGAVVAAWTDATNVFYATRFPGQAWSAATKLWHSSAKYVGDVAVAVADGTAHFVWFDPSGGSGDIFYDNLALSGAPVSPGGAQAISASVLSARFDPVLSHNIPNLEVPLGGQTLFAPFLDFYDRTGGLARWGLPTSEVFEETAGTLTQYYQRGVIDWKPLPDGTHALQRRLAWDFIGGGAGGAPDFGVEPGLFNPNPGALVGPWGHRVSDVAVDGTQVGFGAFFDRLGGVESFGFPKTDARPDTHRDAVLSTPGKPQDDRIRQYFQAVVLEFHPESPADPVKLSLIGDTLRNTTYPNDAWQQIAAFQQAAPLSLGQQLPWG